MTMSSFLGKIGGELRDRIPESPKYPTKLSRI